MPKSDSSKSTKGEIQTAKMAWDIGYIKEKVDEVEKKLTVDYVTQAQFVPVQKIVYGLVALILVAVVGALMSLVILQN